MGYLSFEETYLDKTSETILSFNETWTMTLMFSYKETEIKLNDHSYF